MKNRPAAYYLRQFLRAGTPEIVTIFAFVRLVAHMDPIHLELLPQKLFHDILAPSTQTFPEPVYIDAMCLAQHGA